VGVTSSEKGAGGNMAFIVEHIKFNSLTGHDMAPGAKKTINRSRAVVVKARSVLFKQQFMPGVDPQVTGPSSSSTIAVALAVGMKSPPGVDHDVSGYSRNPQVASPGVAGAPFPLVPNEVPSPHSCNSL